MSGNRKGALRTFAKMLLVIREMLWILIFRSLQREPSHRSTPCPERHVSLRLTLIRKQITASTLQPVLFILLLVYNNLLHLAKALYTISPNMNHAKYKTWQPKTFSLNCLLSLMYHQFLRLSWCNLSTRNLLRQLHR